MSHTPVKVAIDLLLEILLEFVKKMVHGVGKNRFASVIIFIFCISFLTVVCKYKNKGSLATYEVFSNQFKLILLMFLTELHTDGVRGQNKNNTEKLKRNPYLG